MSVQESYVFNGNRWSGHLTDHAKSCYLGQQVRGVLDRERDNSEVCLLAHFRWYLPHQEGLRCYPLHRGHLVQSLGRKSPKI
jgi:hypothetical protein